MARRVPGPVPRARRRVLAPAVAMTVGVGAAACSAGHSSGAAASDAATGAKRLDGPLYIDAGCPVVIESPPLLAGTHVAIGTSVSWSSNPPSSGEHFPVWAAYQSYATPVPRGYYVHDLEHGAIVLLYDCGDAGCPDVVAALQAASNALPADALCSNAAEGVRVRTVISPDPLLDVPVAAAAWGWTYKAQCVDLPSLTQFVLDHYGQGPESLCANGTTAF